MTDDTIIGSHADYHPGDYAFARSIREGRTPDIGLEKSDAPIESWSRTIGHAAVYCLFFLACYYVLPKLMGVVINWWIGGP